MNIINGIFQRLGGRNGFSLVELLVTLAITGIIMSGVYAVYIANLRAVSVDEERVEIQQGQRFAMDFLVRELRHAGYDLEDTGLPTIVEAGADYIYFTADLSGCDKLIPDCASPPPGGPFPDRLLDDTGEHIVFCIYDNNLGYYTTDDPADIGVLDGNADGFVDSTHTHAAPSHQAVATIERLEFFYTLADGTTTRTPTKDGSVDIKDIRSVEISLLSKADNSETRTSLGAQSFTPASGAVTWGAYNDDVRRMMMITNVRFRNMGL